jgi:hypothetical protein
MGQHLFKPAMLIVSIVWFSASTSLAEPAFLDKAGAGARALDIAVEGVRVWRLGIFEQAGTGKKGIRFGICNGAPSSIRWYTQYVELKKAGRVVCTSQTTVKGIAPGQELVFDVLLVCGQAYDGIDYGYELKADATESRPLP